MTRVLILKLLRDVRLPLLAVCLLLALFQGLWARVTTRIVEELLPSFTKLIPLEFIAKTLFEGSGKILQALMGGETISLDRAADMLSVGYVHPLTQTIFCIWAIGRASGAIAGEIDRGTMELLLAQPIARTRVILAHLGVDLIVIPILCLSTWIGTWLGVWLTGMLHLGAPIDSRHMQIDPRAFGPALANAAALIFAVSGYTMWLSARGRFRGRVMGVAVLLTLLMFLINVIGQLWEAAGVLRPFSVFFYYQPQQIILFGRWSIDLGLAWNDGKPLFAVNMPVVLFTVGAVGYLLAWRKFCRRDLPAPL